MLQVIVASFFALLIGMAFLLYGYRLFLVMLPIWGFFAGFWLGAQTIAMHSWAVASWPRPQAGLWDSLPASYWRSCPTCSTSSVWPFVAAAFGAALGSGLMAAMGFDAGVLVAVVAIVSALVAAGLTSPT
jgi:hypothetical protein